MAWSKSFLALALAGVWIVAGCSANPSSPDVEMTAPDSPSGSLSAGQVAAKRIASGGRGDGPVIYVTSQQLYYDSIVTADPLPWKGPFQELKGTPPNLYTEFGPGDQEYVGGRWWMDISEPYGVMDSGDHYFSCPLLGPGRAEP
jgi:hypothetical protein